jgi:AraC family transcriptional regulator
MLTNSVFADIDPSPIAAFEGRFPRLLQPASSPVGDRRAHFSNGQVRSIEQARRTPLDRQALNLADHVVEISPRDAVTRRTVISDGITAEIVQASSRDRFESRFCAPVHLLVVYEQGARRDGDTFVEGLSRSTLRDFARRLTFVPAGHEYREWQDPRSPTHLMYVYFDPAQLQVPSDGASFDAVLSARLFFEDATLLDTALKLKRSLENPTSANGLYLEALGVVLAHELIRFNHRAPRNNPQIRGGLATWQQRIVTAHIDAHLSETIPLAALAELARLSPYYFCRAFKRSFGVPPHRYHTSRRIEHAKTLLATRAHSVTDIGLTVGYSETSSFTAAFRKATGLTPSGYQRSLG